jgi:hypothetical protein
VKFFAVEIVVSGLAARPNLSRLDHRDVVEATRVFCYRDHLGFLTREIFRKYCAHQLDIEVLLEKEYAARIKRVHVHATAAA